MSEIKNEIKENADGSFTITDAHSTADIVRWLLTQDSKETILYLLKEALAQPEQEPININHKHEWFRTGEMKVGQMRCISCGTWGQEEMPQRTWVDLNTNQILDIYQEVLKEWRGGHQVNGQIAFAKAIQDKFKEVNT